MKTIIIGDIHGCSVPFQKLLDKVKPDPEADRLILLGDLFDRGPDSWRVFKMVKALEAEYGDRFILIRGNHEDYLISEHLTMSQRMTWERVGRKATVKSFKQHRAKMEESAPWIREHSVLFYKGEGFQCVHAGIKVDPPEANDGYTLMHDHGIAMENRYAGPLTITGHIALPTAVWFSGDGETYEKLSEEEQYTLPEKGLICIDTGCGKGGRLTAMVLEEGSYTLRGVSGQWPD